MQLPKAFDFSSLEKIEIPVKGPDGKDYVLREATGAGAKKYRSYVGSCFNQKKGTVNNIGEIIPLIVSLCLYDASTNKLVPQALVESWPDKVQQKLADAAKKISELDQVDNVVQTELKKALSTAGAPVSYSALKEWVKDLEEDEFPALKQAFKEVDEILKNE